MLQQLLGQGIVGLRAPGEGVIGGHRLAKAGGLGQADVTGDHRGVHLAGEVAFDLLRHLHGEIGTAVVHGEYHPLQGNFGVEGSLDNANGGEKVAEPLQGVVLTLHRYQYGIRCTQGVEGQ